MEVCLKGLLERGYAPQCILDIGAAVGDWTRLCLHFWPRARYFLIEPLEERRSALAALKAACPAVDFLIAGAGDRPGKLPLGITADLYGSSFAYSGQEERLVDVVTLNDLFARRYFPQPQFLKLDVQGFELNVLEGGSQLIAACDLILLELQFFRFSPAMKLMHESIAWMAERRFYPYEIVDVLRRPLDGAMGQCDLLFAREGHWLIQNHAWS
jgi:FkbM family methyltransferase